jgi:hypothetical protein
LERRRVVVKRNLARARDGAREGERLGAVGHDGVGGAEHPALDGAQEAEQEPRARDAGGLEAAAEHVVHVVDEAKAEEGLEQGPDEDRFLAGVDRLEAAPGEQARGGRDHERAVGDLGPREADGNVVDEGERRQAADGHARGGRVGASGRAEDFDFVPEARQLGQAFLLGQAHAAQAEVRLRRQEQDPPAHGPILAKSLTAVVGVRYRKSCRF